jgi:hypothetical protein
MAVQETEVLAILEANYKKALEQIPADMATEFQRRIITTDDLKSYARSISTAVQFKNTTACLQIQNRVIEQFNFRGFGTKLAQKGINPSSIYELLLKGFFDYK